MSDQNVPVKKVAYEEEEFVKLGVECGGPTKKVPAGSKEASEGCPDCGAKHDTE